MKISTKIISLSSFLVVLVTSLPNCVFAQINFVENKGQWHPNIKYKGDFNTGSFYLENKGFTVLLQKQEDITKLSETMHGISGDGSSPSAPPHGTPSLQATTASRTPGNSNESFIFHNFVYKVNFLGAADISQQVPEKQAVTYYNYFLGNDRTKWATNCRIFQTITYKNIYPNIDVRYYSNGEKLKYDFIVRPGGNVNAIAMRYDGPTSLTLKNKELIISTPVGDVKELYPYSYQAGINARNEVECKYVLRDNVVSFQVKNYDFTQTLIIDPSIVFSSFTGSRVANWGYTATPGPDGSFFAGGIAFGNGYTTTPGAFNEVFSGGVAEGSIKGYDMAIFKYSPDGSQQLYGTYIGGSGNEQPHSMIVDPQGNLVIAGRTNSPLTTGGGIPYPLVPAGNTKGPCGGFDIIITKLNAAGNQLIGSTRIGGQQDDGVNIRPKYETPAGAGSTRRNYGDDARSEVILDASNNVYLASVTQSDDFPVVNSTIQTTLSGIQTDKVAQDGVILKCSPDLTNILFSTYFGGTENDACFVMALNEKTSDLYIGGATESQTLPGNTTGVISGQSGGDVDGFVTSIRMDGSAVLKTTFIGTSDIDIVYGLKLDRNGFPYIMGTTTSNSWQIKNAGYGIAGSKQFIAKLQPDLSAYIYSTVFGNASRTDPDISPVAFLVDRCENVYVTGWGGGPNKGQGYSSGSTAGLIEKDPLTGIGRPDGNDFYFFVLEKNAASVLFASHFGQFGGFGDHVDGGTSRFDENGVIYQAICANCGGGATFPITPGVVEPRNRSVECNQAAVKINMNFAGVSANVRTIINNIPDAISGCNPLKVNVFDSISRATKYFWDWGDGTKSDTLMLRSDTSHLYNLPAGVDERVYTIRLIAEDSSKCNIRDTAYKTIKVSTNFVTLNFNFTKLDPCTNLSYQFTNLSKAFIGSFDNKGFIWDFGDGTTDTGSISYNPIHRYLKTGKYTVKLCVVDSFVCNSPDCSSKDIRIDSLVIARFTTPATGCAPYTAIFKNQSNAGTDFKWQFENGTVFSTDVETSFLFANVGVYKVRLIATDQNTCNKIDTSAYFTITVIPKPKALATWSPIPPLENVPVSFRNMSSNGAVRYLWNFGDGESATQFEPVHEYNATGTYAAELIAYNREGCTDTFRMSVAVVVLPLLDVPNAFTPGKFGTNGIVKVRGFGIAKLAWRIYNRWGQIVFESSNKENGWNGTFKGKLQPMDVYTYTLDAEFSDGKKVRKTGDITLLR